jgi:serine carboxypeptidase-like clade 1
LTRFPTSNSRFISMGFISTRNIAASMLAFASLSTAAVPGDQVTSLPGWNGPLMSAMYSGYLNIPGGKHLHYIFIESTRSPKNDPVVMWLNGGPGCSSLEGLFSELGPYHITPGTTELYANPYTWNNISNLLFLEAPAGVGFSYADTPSGLIFNDTVNANDNLAAVKAFFKGFPEFASNEFYLTGESYAGIYVPTTAYAIVQDNLQGGTINIKGIAVGNGCLGTEVGICGDDNMANWYDLTEWRGHGLISSGAFNDAKTACGNFSGNNPSNDCINAMNNAANQIGHVDIYYIYGPCITNFTAIPELAPVATWEQLQEAKASIEAGKVLRKPLAHGFRRPPNKFEIATNIHNRMVGGPDACIDAGDMTWYLNLPQVITALHAVEGIPWAVCSGNISYTPTETDERQIIYPTLIEQANLRVSIINGEADACVPYTDNEAWTASMNYSVVSPWQPWMYNEENVGGYVTVYQHNFTFATFKGAGHMIPQFTPEASWYFINNYLTNGAL